MAKKTQEVVNDVKESVNEVAQQPTTFKDHPAVHEVAVKEFYEVSQKADGKFQRKAVYQFFASVVAETRAQKINMMNLLNGDGGALPMGEHVGAEFKVQDVIFQPYDAVDEETGELLNGVLTYLFDTKGAVYVTSSKSVYFTLKRVFQVFGAPHWSADEAVEVKVVKEKGKEFQYIDLKILG